MIQLGSDTGLKQKNPLDLSWLWRVMSAKSAYYLELIDDDAHMNQISLVPLISLIKKLTNNVVVKDIKIESKSYDLKPYQGNTVEEYLLGLTQSAQSPWYVDAVLIAVELKIDAKIFIVPEGDGTQVGMYITGSKAKEIFNDFCMSLKNMA